MPRCFLQFFDGEDFSPLVRAIRHADTNPDLELEDMRERCLEVVCRSHAPAASEALFRAAYVCRAATQADCLREIRERKPRELFPKLKELIQHNRLHEENFNLAVSTLDAVDRRRARRLRREPGVPLGFLEKLNEYFRFKDDGPDAVADAPVVG